MEPPVPGEPEPKDLEAEPEPEEPEPEEPRAPEGAKRGALLLVAGGLLAGAGLLIFPGSLLETSRGAHDRHGLPFWILGLILAGAGLWELALSRRPALAEAVRRRPILPVLLGLGFLATLIALTYR